MSNAYLYPSERTAVDTLGQDLTNGLTAQDETLECFESARQIKMRCSMADFDVYPKLKEVAQKVIDGQGPDNLTIDDMPTEAQQELFFMIGARGVNAIIQTLLPEIHSADDVEAFASLSRMRHRLLEINSSSVHH